MKEDEGKPKSKQDKDEIKTSAPCLGGVAAALGRRGGSSDRLHNSLKLRTFRTTLRKNLTPAEAKLWKYLQRSKLDGPKFRRQLPSALTSWISFVLESVWGLSWTVKDILTTGPANTIMKESYSCNILESK